MKWVADTTGRFKRRPYYAPEELDSECERIVTEFLFKKYGAARFPLSTDDLSVLVERDTSDLDLFADLSRDGGDVEGTTDFFPHKKPAVKIARELSLESEKQPRLRTTLAHEYGHVKFHNFLWGLEPPPKPPPDMMQKLVSQRKAVTRMRRKLSPERYRGQPDGGGSGIMALAAAARMISCPRGRIIQAPASDWMEWQAGYASGALLMPFSVVRSIAGEGNKAVPADSARAHELVNKVAAACDVSAEAAAIRLQKLNIILQSSEEAFPSP
jgi:hypothetical protein